MDKTTDFKVTVNFQPAIFYKVDNMWNRQSKWIKDIYLPWPLPSQADDKKIKQYVLFWYALKKI